MTINELTDIIKTADPKAITKQLKELDYIDCKKHKEYGIISLTTLFGGDLQETDEFFDDKGKRSYQGGIIMNVNGYEQLEFLLVNINDVKKTFPIDILIGA